MLFHAIFSPTLLWALFVSDSQGILFLSGTGGLWNQNKLLAKKKKLYLPKISFGSYFS